MLRGAFTKLEKARWLHQKKRLGRGGGKLSSPKRHRHVKARGISGEGPGMARQNKKMCWGSLYLGGERNQISSQKKFGLIFKKKEIQKPIRTGLCEHNFFLDRTVSE